MKKEILLIEDEEAYRELVKHFLEDEFKIYEAQKFEEGLEILSKTQIEVIIFDLSLPDVKDEKEVLQALQQLRNIRNSRIIILTGESHFLNEDKAEKFAFSYLEKGNNFSETAVKFAIKHAFYNIAHKNLEELSEAQLDVQEQINSKSFTLSNVLSQICEGIVQLTGCYTCHIRLLQQKKGDYKKEAYAGPEGVELLFSLPSKPEELYSGRVAATNKPKIITDLQNDPEFIAWKKNKLAADATNEVKKYLETIKCAYIFPISTGLFHNKNEVDAILNISADHTNFLTPDKEKAINVFIKQIEMAVIKDLLDKKRWEVHNDYKQSNNILENISKKLIDDYELTDIYKIAIDGISEIIGPEMISIFIFNENTDYLENVAEVVGGEKYESNEKHRPGHDITGKVYKDRKAKRIPDETYTKSPLEHEWYDKSQMENDLGKMPSGTINHYLCVPMIVGEEALGVIRLINKKSEYYKDLEKEKLKDDPYCLLKRGFSADCETVLGIIANHLAIAIQNANLFSRLTQRIEQQEKIAVITRKIGAYYEGKKDDLLKEIVDITAEVTNSSICMLFLKEYDDSTCLILEGTYGLPMIEGAFYELSEDRITSKVALSGEPFLKGKEVKSEANAQYKGKYDNFIIEHLRKTEDNTNKIDSYMIAPIFIDSKIYKNKKEILGALKVINKKSDEKFFSEEDLIAFGAFASQIGLAITVTERNETFSNLIGGVEHEIRNSIGIIQPNVEKLQERLTNLPEKDKNALERIRKVTISTNEFNNDLVGFQEYSEKDDVNINNVIEECLSSIADISTVENFLKVNVVRDYKPKDIICHIYETPFRHIVNNILINAYHAMEIHDGNGKLKITTRIESSTSNTRVQIDFADNGEGISEDKISRIFKPRFTTKNNPKGNGLGLWLVKTALKRIDGSIKVKSYKNADKKNDEFVTIFTILLPHKQI